MRQLCRHEKTKSYSDKKVFSFGSPIYTEGIVWFKLGKQQNIALEF